MQCNLMITGEGHVTLYKGEGDNLVIYTKLLNDH